MKFGKEIRRVKKTDEYDEDNEEEQEEEDLPKIKKISSQDEDEEDEDEEDEEETMQELRRVAEGRPKEKTNPFSKQEDRERPTEKVKPHQPGDIEPILDVVGFRVWANDKEYDNIALKDQHLVGFIGRIYKALGSNN